MRLAGVDGIHGKQAWIARTAQPHTGRYRAKQDHPPHFPISSSVNLDHHLLSTVTSHRSILACDSPVISWLCFRYPGSIIHQPCVSQVVFPSLPITASLSSALAELLRSLHFR